MNDLPETNSRYDTEWALPAAPLTIYGKPFFFPYPDIKYEYFVGPQDGFGSMWHKTYRLSLSKSDVSPEQLIHTWKTQFPRFWTKGNHFIGGKGRMNAGDVAVLNLAGPKGITAPGGLPMISTGVLVVFSHDTAFTFITLTGHMFAGIINFSSFEEGDRLIAQIDILIRANDFLYELGMRMGVITSIEDRFWTDALHNLAAYIDQEGEVKISSELIDLKVQWKRFWNIWKNAAIRTTLYTLTHPLKWIQRNAALNVNAKL